MSPREAGWFPLNWDGDGLAREQEQFLDVVDRDTAERLWWEALRPQVLDAERVALSEALGRVLAVDVAAGVDVPAFDRSNVDGFALRAEETFGASEEQPRRFRLNREELATGVVPRAEVGPGTATAIATGGMVPRGADAVVMVEHALVESDGLDVFRPVAPGANVSFAGTDMALGELVLRRGTRLSARETGVLAAIGCGAVEVVRRPRVAILSTGDEVIAPGTAPRPAAVYDSNATLLADAVRELGGEPAALGIVGDDERALDAALERGLGCDLVLLSGGTSKGGGDLSYRVLQRRRPGVIVHGVALKPGKPICLGAVETKPVVVLPGFPTSAIFTFHEFVAPLIRFLQGLQAEKHETLTARMPARFNSEIGRTEYLLVNLVDGPRGLTAYPLGKGSGSVTTFSRADGFVVIPRSQEYLEAGEVVAVTPLGRGTEPADFVTVGSHCVGLDALLGILAEEGYGTKAIWVGSQGGLLAAGRGECDAAGIHLLDPRSNTYNRPFLPDGVRLLPGYGRMQGVVFRAGDRRFEEQVAAEAVTRALDDPACHMVNRNRGSGTRVLMDELLGGSRPPGYAVEARSHNAVAAAVAQGRADWGVAIAPVAAAYGLAFLPLRAERYDFAIPAERWDRPAVAAFRLLLDRPEVRRLLTQRGFLLEGGEP
jgi:putative molybdopterin biosynthesis protein